MGGSTYSVYVTFHGSGSKAENNILAIPWSGSAPSQPLKKPHADLLEKKPAGYTYSEMRGMALDELGLLYVANGSKDDSAVYAFGTLQDGVRSPIATLVAQAANPGIDHPYGLALNPSPSGGGALFVSNQNSNAVCAYIVDGGTAPQATPTVVAPYLINLDPKGTFYPGETVASQLGVTEGTITPPNVPAPAGLSMSWNPNVAGDADAYTDADADVPDAAKKKKPAKHSVRGVLYVGGTLFVADEDNGSVNLYDAVNGTYVSQVTGLDGPVGLAFDASNALVYIAAKSSISTYDTRSGSLTTVMSGLSEVSGIAVGPDGYVFYASRADMAVYVFSPQQQQRIDGLVVGAIPIAVDLKDEPECLLIGPA